jgi:hypothetical protein
MKKDFTSFWLLTSVMIALALCSCGRGPAGQTQQQSNVSAPVSGPDFDTDCVHATDIDVVVVLYKGHDQDAEIPLLELCPTNASNSSGGTVVLSNLGDLTLSEGKKAYASIHFYLDASLQHHFWKSDPNQSVWLADDVVKPTAANWPGCMTSPRKDVKALGQAEVYFSLCETMGQSTWLYALHLDHKGRNDNVTVDVGIDPQIINRPHALETSKP